MSFLVLFCLILISHAASVKADFKDSRDHCSGNVKILYRGQRHPVCKETLNDTNVQNTICRELQCGESGEPVEFFGPLPQSPPEVVSGLSCPANSNKLADCNLTVQDKGQCTLGGLQCSGRFYMLSSDPNVLVVHMCML